MLRPALRMQGIERTLIRQIFDAAPADAINLGLGQPALPTPARIRLAGIRGIAEGRTAYTSTAGDGALRAAVARRYAGFVPAGRRDDAGLSRVARARQRHARLRGRADPAAR